MHTTVATTVGIIPFLLCLLSVSGNDDSSEYISQDILDQRKNAVRILEFHEVDKEHACSLIRCSKEDVCAVLDNVALCIERHKAKQILKDATQSLPDSSVEIMVEKPLNLKKKHPSFTHPAKKKNIHSLGAKLEQLKRNRKGPKHVEEYDQPCTDHQLVVVEDLLVNWFSALHKQSTNADNVPLPEHHLRCQPDVGWMFTQLDANQDGYLEHDELYTLDHEKYKNCIHHFLDQCDLDEDARLSVDEWCDCFEWAGREREEPPCHAARRLVDPHMLGAFRPRCSAEGFYRPEQCHEDRCWCVDKWGREFDHSTNIGHADCGQYAEPEDDVYDEDKEQ